jgi:hypothetical protein
MRTIRLLILALLFASSVSAQNVVINDTFAPENGGKLVHSGNELIADSRVDDPPAMRLGSPGPGEALGKFSFDRISASGAGALGGRKERVLIIGKSGPNGEGFIEFFAQMPGTEDDKGMVRLLTMHPTEGIIFYGPVQTRARGSEYDPPGGHVPAPQDPNASLLDVDLRNNNGAYHVFVAMHTETVEAIRKWYREVNKHEAGAGDVAHALWRAFRESDRWVTLRAALQEAWPK